MSVRQGAIHFVLPGSLAARTGGTIYDRRMVSGLRAQGRAVDVHELPGRYPTPGPVERAAADDLLDRIPAGALVLVDGLALGALPEWAARASERVRLVALVHHPLCDETGLAPEAARALAESEGRALARARAVVTTSPFTARRLRELGWLPDDARSVEPGVEAGRVAPPRRRGAPFRLLSIGAVTPRKAHLDGLHALRATRCSDWSWRIVGRLDVDTSSVRALRAAIQAHGLESHVTLLGSVPDKAVRRELESAHALLHPARYEGYGMALVEALAHGLPIVTTTGGALAETLPPDAGVAVSPGDREALSRALERLMSGDALYHAWREGALAARTALRSWEDAAQEFARAIEVS